MINNIQAVRGMNDYLPKDTVLWQYVENILKRVLYGYGYSEIRLPIVEQTPLFQRAIGKVTDVVEKEMYVFDDRKHHSLTLRPEGTASCARAVIEHGLLYNQEQRLWYIGPMFRYERPQKGRYRQFHQLGVEVFGLYGPEIDAELILLTSRWWKNLGITEYIKLELNSIGSLEARMNYRNALVSFLEQHMNVLDEDCKRRIYRNPLRILDSKTPEVQTLLSSAPRLSQYLDKASHDHFTRLCDLLEQAHIPYTINECLVRGMDYYNRTVFEWSTTSLGSQGAICAGGRYDNLVEQLGGHKAPAVGFAVGLERLILLVQELDLEFATIRSTIDIYLISYGTKAQSTAMKLAERIHDALPQIKLMTHYGKGDFKKQMTRAHKCGARVALILGDNEVVAQQVLVKTLHNNIQETLAQSKVAARLAQILS